MDRDRERLELAVERFLEFVEQDELRGHDERDMRRLANRIEKVVSYLIDKSTGAL